MGLLSFLKSTPSEISQGTAPFPASSNTHISGDQIGSIMIAPEAPQIDPANPGATATQPQSAKEVTLPTPTLADTAPAPLGAFDVSRQIKP